MLTVVPVDQVDWTDLQAIFGDRGDPARCRCQYFKDTPAEWRAGTPGERAERLREQTAERATGIVAFLDGEPAGGGGGGGGGAPPATPPRSGSFASSRSRSTTRPAASWSLMRSAIVAHSRTSTPPTSSSARPAGRAAASCPDRATIRLTSESASMSRCSRSRSE